MCGPPNVKAESHNLSNSNPHFPCLFMPLGEGERLAYTIPKSMVIVD